MIEHAFANEAALVAALAGEICDRLQDGVIERGRASLVVTGGSTPGPLYDTLSGCEAPWSKTFVTLTDERWVSSNHAGSNERFIRERLLKGAAGSAHFIPLKTDDPTPAAALEAADARVAAMPRPFDAVLLGMGEDGHFASLFPGNPALMVGLDAICAESVVAVEEHGAAGSPHRLSLTLSALTDARWIALMITGRAKLDRLRRPGQAPIASLLRQTRVPVEVFWAP
jgi:6-phosphogluconolactonase